MGGTLLLSFWICISKTFFLDSSRALVASACLRCSSHFCPFSVSRLIVPRVHAPSLSITFNQEIEAEMIKPNRNIAKRSNVLPGLAKWQAKIAHNRP